jgi:hypothetical protein
MCVRDPSAQEKIAAVQSDRKPPGQHLPPTRFEARREPGRERSRLWRVEVEIYVSRLSGHRCRIALPMSTTSLPHASDA